MYKVKLNKIDSILNRLALDPAIFEKDSNVDDRVLNSYREVIMENQINVEKTPNKAKGWNIKKTLGVFAGVVAAALIVGALGLAGVFTPSDKIAAYVAMEINPGIILEIDKSESVKSVAFANAEAKQLLHGVDLTGSNSLSALGTIAVLAQREGYLTQGAANDIMLMRFSNKNDKEKFFMDAEEKIKNVLGFGVSISTKQGSLEEGAAYVKFKEDQPMAANIDAEDDPSASNPPPPPPSPSFSPLPSFAPTATTGPIMPAADSAGTGDVMFDIYDTTCIADIDNDGSDDVISFAAGNSSSTLTVDGVDYTINQHKLAQKFAITDVDISDGWIEIAFTDIDDPPEHDLDHPNTYYYWFNGSTFIECGSFWIMGWDGQFRAGFNANDHMDGHGMIMSVDRSPNFTDAWYMAHWELAGANRQKKEDLYATALLYPTPDLTLDMPCILLKNIDLDYFDTPYNSMWDHASWPHSEGRAIDPGGTGDVVIIAQPGETLEVVKVYGKRWFKLKTTDGYQGWVRVVEYEMSGYDDVMYIDVWDIFVEIFNAG